MTQLDLLQWWKDQVKDAPICAGRGHVVSPDDIEDHMLCRQCLQQLSGQQVSWTKKEAA